MPDGKTEAGNKELQKETPSNLRKIKRGLPRTLKKFTEMEASERLLFVLSEPKNYLLPIHKICKLAKCSLII